MSDSLSFILNELGEEHPHGSVATPLYQTSMFAFESVEQMRRALAEETQSYFYTRGNNPTFTALERKLAALEGTEAALLFASGSAAVAAAVMANVEQGSHVVCVQKPYSWTNKLLTKLLARFGVEVSMVDGTRPENFAQAIRPNTRLLYLESPNSFTFELQDIAACVAVARQHGLLTIIDNSYATPLNQRPADMGVDIVVHSASKYIGGHSDVVAGILCCSQAMREKIFSSEYMTLGGVMAPFNAWLLLRGLRTLALRVERVAQTTPKVVDFLARHPKVEAVLYPFHPSHPQYELAKKQMKRPGGMFSFRLRANEMAEVERFCNRLQRFLLACSWGGYESLIFPACTLYGSANYQNPWLDWRLVRVYIGLEDADELIADLRQALECL
ncbi:MAG: methionine gamma-lyase [Thermonema sp.]|uniref:trans-sulfuration enzyme family protein n=1 Tax=Thermonema sp. TaxID=2231181 RepID=UPI0021DC3BA8|nr:aminotransferase class I/II-fold pyridoxal phosphate-dependent enzyme [Thermonema sp.]GIV39750.1 MAG: methionine gamma-lyase [Thermonema sp.]